ncbi:E3 ubiquitin-protein ligase TRIM71-like [Ruditapes philippinarum]|uniref:E3 ubiquitin-protein ligase TRIM71-like n=1 Tax=Ruditapes philippinarum TaxID=129788 RepID=UPI00295BCA5C|nr:E3 ubiquitin-protein ligase TRIM71-like [Ruditapes philippinarum]
MAVQGKKATKQFSSSTTSMGSDEDLKVYCQPCDRDGPRLPAHGYCTNCSEHLCETCFTVHKRHTLSRHHTLQDKSSMPQTLSPVTPRQPDNFTKPCPKHNMEMIKFYCHDHEALLCSVCVTLDHTAASCKVNYIPDISDKVTDSKDYQDILKDINDMTERSSKTLQDIKKRNDESNKSLSNALTDIKKFRTKINQRLDELESIVKEAAQVIQKDNSKALMKVETVCGDVQISLKSSMDAVKHFNTSKQANDLFMELKQAKQMIKDYKQNVTLLSETEVKEYNFEPNEAISNLLDKEKSIGTLSSKTLQPDLKSRPKLHLLDKICIKTSRDTDHCCIRGMTLLTSDLLIVTDWFNNAIKMIDINRKSVLAQQSFASQPTDVTSVSQNEVAVTLPSNYTVQFINISQNNFRNKHTVKVDGKCSGIRCHKDKMVVSFLHPPKVQIHLINGTLLQTIQDEHIFKTPRYIATSDNFIYVSDTEMKTVTKLNWQCEVKGKYVCSGQPYGLATSEDGSLYFCNFDSNAIEELSEDFTEGEIVVKDIQKPQNVFWSAERCTLYVSSSSGNDTNEDNFIKMFRK